MNYIPGNIRSYLKKFKQYVLLKSLQKAAKEQKLNTLAIKLEEIVPDIRHQIFHI